MAGWRSGGRTGWHARSEALQESISTGGGLTCFMGGAVWHARKAERANILGDGGFVGEGKGGGGEKAKQAGKGSSRVAN